MTAIAAAAFACIRWMRWADGDGLTDTDMARFARWTNLGETTYVTTPKSEGADFGLRFFPLTVNFRSLDTPRWGRCTRGSNPAENRGAGTSSCSNVVSGSSTCDEPVTRYPSAARHCAEQGRSMTTTSIASPED